jgi:hypothetical protein
MPIKFLTPHYIHTIANKQLWNGSKLYKMLKNIKKTEDLGCITLEEAFLMHNKKMDHLSWFEMFHAA